MGWGLEYFAFMDPFSGGVIGLINSFLFLFAFSYIAGRGSGDNPLETSLEVIGLAFVGGFILQCLGLPPLVVGFGYLFWYILANKIVLKMEWDLDFFVFVLYFLFIFGLLAIMDPMMRTYLSWFAIILYWFMSEIRVREKARKKAAAPVKK